MKPLYPIMAVVVIASAGALPLRARAADGSQAQADANHPVNAMQRVFNHENADVRAKVREDAGVRIREFTQEFIKGGLPAGEASDLATMGYNWGKERGSVSDVAHLYFVLGPGTSQPQWASNDPILKTAFTPEDRRWRAQLRRLLAKYRETPIANAANANAFFPEAAAAAVAAFNEVRTSTETTADVNRRNDPGAVPDTRTGTGTAGGLGNVPRQQYTLDDQYKHGAKWGPVSGPKDDGPRTISMKIYTKRMPDGSVVNEIGIFDISNTNDIFGRRFPIGSNDQDFVLDDRTPGNKKYKLKFGPPDEAGNRTITLQRPEDGGQALETSVFELFNKRADQAASLANMVRVGDKDFYVMPQGGSKGSLLFFAKEQIDGRGRGDPRDLVPGLYSDVCTRGSDTRCQNVAPGAKGGPHLGKLGDKEYHLEFNRALGLWEVKEGAGDVPAPPPAAGAAAAGGDPTAGGSTAGGTPAGSGDTSLAASEARILTLDPTCKKKPDDLKDLASELRGRYSILICGEGTPKGRSAIILFPPAAQNPEGQLQYGTMVIGKDERGRDKQALLQRARFFGHYTVLVYDGYLQYSDMRQFEGREFVRRGSMQNKSASGFTEIPPFIDFLRNHSGATGRDTAAADAVPARARQVAGSKSFELGAAFAGTDLIVTVLVDGRSIGIWPTVDGPGGSAPSDAYRSINGPTNAMDNTAGATSSSDPGQNFPDPQNVASSHKLRQLRAWPEQAPHSIVMYENVEVAGQPVQKKHYIMFKFKGVDDPSKPEAQRKVVTFFQPQFEVFNSTSPLPPSYEMQGLTGVDDPVVADRMKAGYRYVPGSTAAKGAIIMVQNKALTDPNQTSVAANCVGPLVWWGMNLGAAQTACKQDKL